MVMVNILRQVPSPCNAMLVSFDFNFFFLFLYFLAVDDGVMRHRNVPCIFMYIIALFPPCPLFSLCYFCFGLPVYLCLCFINTNMCTEKGRFLIPSGQLSHNLFGSSIWDSQENIFISSSGLGFFPTKYRRQVILCWHADIFNLNLRVRPKRVFLGFLRRARQRVKFWIAVFTRLHTIIIQRSFFGVFITLQSKICTRVHLRVHSFVRKCTEKSMQEDFSLKEEVAEFDDSEAVQIDFKDVDDNPVSGTYSSLPTPILKISASLPALEPEAQAWRAQAKMPRF